MKKKVIKPFSVEEWKNGARVETRDGRPVRILCTDMKGSSNTPICAAVTISHYGESETAVRYTADGHLDDDECNDDLVIVEEVEEPERWADDKNATGEGWYIGFDSTIWEDETSLNDPMNFNEFATERLAKSALAMARISQLMAHDERYGGGVTDEEWMNPGVDKYGVVRRNGVIKNEWFNTLYCFLAFHTPEQRDLFLQENERLVKDYLMID